MLQARMGFQFADQAILRQALVHRSLVNEVDMSRADSNERMEFLGDAVLGLVTTEMLYQRHPDYDEGLLSRIRSSLVNRNAAASFAKALDLGSCLQVAAGAEKTGARQRSSILGRAFEALVGAIYLDAGLDSARSFLTPFLDGALSEGGTAGPQKDVKGQLQECLAAQRAGPPVYMLVDAIGPEHAPRFRMVVIVDGEQLAEGEGSSKQRAEQRAASAALQALAGKG